MEVFELVTFCIIAVNICITESAESLLAYWRLLEDFPRDPEIDGLGGFVMYWRQKCGEAIE